LCPGRLKAVESGVARDFAQKRLEPCRSGGWNGVPGFEPGFVDALLGVAVVAQDVVGDPAAVRAKLAAARGQSVLRPLPKQLDDSLVVHNQPPRQKISRHL
jgi:hypothetical protein